MRLLGSRHLPLLTWLAIGWLVLVGSIGLLASWLPLPFAPAVPDLLRVTEAPAWREVPHHWLGTDPGGRDVLAELVFGAQQLVCLSLPAAVLATVMGALAGGAAGFWGNQGLRLPLAAWLLALGAGWWTWALPGGQVVTLALLGMAVAAWGLGRRWLLAKQLSWPLPLDGLFQLLLTLLGAVPRLLLVLLLAAGPPLSSPQFLLLLTIIAWPESGRQVRANMLQARQLPFVEAAHALGLPAARVWLRHALPYACQSLRYTAPLNLAGLIALESTLAFLGVGRPPDVPSWGRLLGTLRQDPGAWWLLASAGSALLLTLLSLQQLARRSPQK